MGVTVKITEDPRIRADSIIGNGSGLRIVVNDVPDDKEEIAKLKSIIFTITGEDLSSRPTCVCGEKDQQSILEYTDQDSPCDICGTTVEPVQNHPMKPYVFIRSPKGVAPFIYPVFFHQLLTTFNTKDKTKDRRNIEFNPIMFLADTGYPNSDHPIAVGLIENGFERGYNNLVNRLPDVISYLSSLSAFNGKTVKKDLLLKTYMRDKDKILTNHLYMINKSLFVIEKSAVKDYMQSGLIDISTVIRMFMGIDRKYAEGEETAYKENVVARSLKRLTDFYYRYFKDMLSGKGGLIKSHIFSTRSVIGMRVVATSAARDVSHDKILLPWGPTITMMHQYLVSKLLKRGYEMDSVLRYINKCVKKYDPMMDELLAELRDEHPDKCFPVIVERFPTLAKTNFSTGRGDYKIDPKDLAATVGLPAVARSNLDFDGDQLHISLVPAVRLWNQMRALDPHNSYYDITGNKGINDFLNLTSCTVGNAGEFLRTKLKTSRPLEQAMYKDFQ